MDLTAMSGRELRSLIDAARVELLGRKPREVDTYRCQGCANLRWSGDYPTPGCALGVKVTFDAPDSYSDLSDDTYGVRRTDRRTCPRYESGESVPWRPGCTAKTDPADR